MSLTPNPTLALAATGLLLDTSSPNSLANVLVHVLLNNAPIIHIKCHILSERFDAKAKSDKMTIKKL